MRPPHSSDCRPTTQRYSQRAGAIVPAVVISAE